MGVSYYAAVIYGLPVSYLVGPAEKVTRYNEITGEPYMKTVPGSHREHFILPDKSVLPVPLLEGHISDAFDEYRYGNDDGYIGIEIATVDVHYTEHQALSSPDMDDLAIHFKGFAEEYFPDIADKLCEAATLMLVSYAY